MFWSEEDIQPVVTAAEQIFGKQGQYHANPFTYVSIEHPKFGTVWYGDIAGTSETVRELTTALTTKTGEKFVARDMGTSQLIIS